MPEVETQTEHQSADFKVLTPEEVKQLPVIERKEYKLQLKNYKKELKKRKYNEYMRVYMSHYRKMRYKYDPAYRERAKIRRRIQYYNEKQQKQQPQSQSQYHTIIKSNLFLNTFI